MTNAQKKYLISSDYDQKWGVTVNTIGWTNIPAGYDHYPTTGHPKGFEFEIDKGRVIDSYQLVYISRGKGVFITHNNEKIEINQGDAFIIKPYVWHSYYPLKKTGWQEYWIGVQGENIDKRFKNHFFDNEQIIYKVGIREDIVDLYQKAMIIAESEKSAHQQVLAGIANLILGTLMYYDKNEKFATNGLEEQINRAKTIMKENLLSNVSLEEIAKMVNMSYSWFRKTFKEYTNLTPAHYIQELKLQKAKYLLVSTKMSIKEIAFELNYENTSHFSTIFKKYVKCTPIEYRSLHKVQSNTNLELK